MSSAAIKEKYRATCAYCDNDFDFIWDEDELLVECPHCKKKSSTDPKRHCKAIAYGVVGVVTIGLGVGVSLLLNFLDKKKQFTKFYSLTGVLSAAGLAAVGEAIHLYNAKVSTVIEGPLED